LVGMANQQMDPEEIKDLYVNQQLSTHEIAKMKGYSPSGVMLHLKRHGVDLRSRGGAAGKRTERVFGFIPTKAWLKAEMKKHEGNATACADAHNLNYQTFVGHLRVAGIPRLAPQNRAAKPAPSWVAEAAKLSTAGTSYADIAAKYDVSYGMVMYYMKKAGHISPKNKQKKHHEHRTLSVEKTKLLKELAIKSCEICDHGRCLDLAHIKPKNEGGKLVKENVLVLCPNDHRAFDKGKLTQDEFLKVKAKVRAAEKQYNHKLPFYGEW
jgi:predicted transcriptional regulator